MWSLLKTRRWLAFTTTAVLAILAFGALSWWQWERAHTKQQENVEILALTTAPALPLAETTPESAEWQHVQVVGEYTGQQELLRRRPLGGVNGFWVLSELSAQNKSVWVARGWVPAPAAANEEVTPPDVPTGSQEVTGYLRATHTEPLRADGSLPAGQIAAIRVPELNNLASTTPATDAWYVQSATGGDLDSLPLPEADDVRNLSYAGQWLLFAGIAVGGWLFFLRREAKDNEEAAVAVDLTEQKEVRHGSTPS